MRHATILAAMITVVTVGVASAGSKFVYNATVNPTSRYAYGSLGSVRNSTDTVESVGCWISQYPDSAHAGCWVTPAVGSGASCSTSDPDMIAAIRSLGGDPLFRFEWNGGTCTRFYVTTSSQYEPRVP